MLIHKRMSAAVFNETYPLGTRFKYHFIKDNSKFIWAELCGSAWTLGDGAVVAKVTSVPGGVSIEHLEPA